MLERKVDGKGQENRLFAVRLFAHNSKGELLPDRRFGITKRSSTKISVATTKPLLRDLFGLARI